MKSIFFTTFIMIGTLYCARQMEDFLQANQYFEKQQFEQAIESYQKINTKGPVLWYNIAQCYIKINQFLDALVAIKKAQINADPTVLAATYTTLKYLQDKITVTHDSKILTLGRWCSAYCSLLWLQIITLLCWFLVALSWHLSILQKFSVRVILLLVLITVTTLMSLVWWTTTQHQAITIKETGLYVGPDIQFTSKSSCIPGQQVTIATTLQNNQTVWYKIKTDQSVGWVPADTIEPIEPTL